jgi:hypothetical protein
MPDIQTFHQIMSDSIKLNQDFIQSQFGIKFQCKFIQQRAQNINLYSRVRPYRMLDLKDVETTNLSQKFTEGDFHGDVILYRSQFLLATFMKITRQYLYRKLYFNEDWLNDEFYDSLLKEINNVINIWVFEDTNNPDHGYLTRNPESFDINNNDLAHLFPIHSFLIEHEVGHLFYNIYVKDMYNAGFSGDEFSLNSAEKIMALFVKNFQDKDNIDIECKEQWIEEFVSDLFAYQICSKINFPFQVIPPFLSSIYGLSFALIILLINNKYFNKIGFDDIPNTHPDNQLRLCAIDNFVGTVNTGKYPEGFRLTKNVINNSREAINFIELLVKEV